MIYADNAATTKLDIEAFEAMKPFLLDQYGNASQPYSFSRSTKKALKQARNTIAACINADADEIYFTSGGTESDNWALKGVMCGLDRESVLATSQIEHHAVLHSANALENSGYCVTYIPVTKNGIVTPELLMMHMGESTKLVSVMLANNEVGSIQPVKELAVIAHQHGAVFHTDAVQAVGHIPIDVKALDVDMLSASAHKFNGPKGIGFLYIKKGVRIHPYQNGGAQEFGLRAGTENVAAIVGMAAALKKNCDNLLANQQHLLGLEKAMLCELTRAGLDYVRNGDPDHHIPGNISLSFRNASGEMLLHRLDLMGICVSTGSACDSQNTQISHVLRALRLDEEYATGTIRISLGKDNSFDDVHIIVNALTRILCQ